MPGISIHVIDVTRGVPATEMRVELWSEVGGRTLLAAAEVDASGGVRIPALANQAMPIGRYEALFHVAAWYRQQGVAVPEPAFLEVVSFRFGIADAQQHYHLPMKITPWGFSLFRGGA